MCWWVHQKLLSVKDFKNAESAFFQASISQERLIKQTISFVERAQKVPSNYINISPLWFTPKCWYQQNEFFCQNAEISIFE